MRFYTVIIYDTVHVDAMSERVSTEHAQFELTNQVAMETLQQERDDLENQLQQRIYENTQLTK